MQRFLFICFVLMITHLDGLPLKGAAGHAYEKGYQEKLFVHTDRDVYVAGEHVNFHVYLMDGQQSEIRSGFVYLALRRADAIVKHMAIPMEKGRTTGVFYIPDTLSTGHYGLTAFTNWMRNQDEQSFFNKQILIVNRFDSEPFADFIARDPSQKPGISFYFEGGTFIQEVDNHVVISSGIPSSLQLREVWIRDMDHDTIAHTAFDVHGIARFHIKPDSAKTYHAIIQGEEAIIPLPEAKSPGCALHVSEENSILSVQILQPPDNPAVDWFRIRHHNAVVYEQMIDPDDRLLHISIAEEEMPEGLLTIEAIDRRREVVARRYWYNEVQDPLGLSIATNRDTIGPREKLRLHLDGSRMTDQHVALSLAVVPQTSQIGGSVRIDGYVRAISLAEKFSMDPDEIRNRIAGMSLNEINRYLITLTASEISLEETQHEMITNGYYMETDKLILSGKVIERETGQVVPNARVVVSTPGFSITMLYTQTGEDGSFHLVLPDFYHNRALYLSTDPATIENPVYIIVDGKYVFQEPFAHARAPLSHDKREYIKRSQDVVRINKAYGIDNMVAANQHLEEEVFAPPLLYARANQTIQIDDFFPLDSLTEIAREIVHSWSLRFRGGEYVSRLTDASTGRTMSGTPVYFLDGIMTDDIGKMVHLNSGDISKIEVHNYRWVHGDMTFPGIIGIFTKDLAYSEILDDRRSFSVLMNSLRDKLMHMPPDYNSQEGDTPNTPDLRQLLYWNPDLVVQPGEQKELTFFSGDLGGEYLIIVQGISENGHPVYQTKSIYVKR